MSTEFVPQYELERLTPDEKNQYYRDACVFLGIPAHLNLLAFIFMSAGDTSRHEVLYAKKGATDFIRDSRGITTLSLQAIPSLVPGQVCFIAAGRDKNGRDEYAVGAASIEGLTGKALSDAIMTAQTRATRRMTLQFVGGGILDESELPDGVTTPLSSVNLEAIRALDAITTQPVVHPNPVLSVVKPPLAELRDGRERGFIPAIIDFHDYRTMLETFGPTPTPSIVEPSSEAQKAAQAALLTVKPKVLMKAAGEQISSVQELAAKLPADNPLVQVITPTPEAPKQRKRVPVPPEILAKLTDPALQSPSNPAGFKGVSPSADIPQSQGSATLPAQAIEPPKVEKKLKPEEEKEIRARLGKYRNEILPAGKMEPIAGVGGVEVQLRTFVQKFYPDKPSSKTWDYADWVYLLNYFDHMVKNFSPAGLVQYIQKDIGVIK